MKYDFTTDHRQFSVKSFSDTDKEVYTFSGTASTFGNPDLEDDIIARGAFSESLRNRTPKLLWQHQHSEIIGKITSIEEVGDELPMEGVLPKAIPRANEAAILMKMKALDSLSIGFTATEAHRETRNGTPFYVIDKAILWEVSAVTFPANPGAKISQIKGVVPFQDLPLGDRDAEWDSAVADRRVREATGATENPSDRYRKAFFWFDSSAPDNFTSYKLPFVDVVDGNLRAMPRAIFAVAAVLNGARGGIDLPENVQNQIKNNVDRYYKKMDLASPFEKNTPLLDIQTVKELDSVRKLEKALRESGVFSRDAAAYLAGRFGLKQGEPADTEAKTIAEVAKTLCEIGKLL